MAITINTSTFPSEGGTFTIQITKDTNRSWNVSLPSAAWLSNVIGLDQTSHLYEIYLDVTENTGSADRSVSFTAGDDLETEAFTLTQYGTGTSLSAEIESASPSGNIAATGGQVTIDIYSNGGNDSLTTASSNQSYCTLTTTTHGVTSGGKTCTRFVFTFSANTGNSNRSATLTFTASNGGSTATTTLTKTQLGVVVVQGTLSLGNMSVAATDTSATGGISQTNMNTATLTASATAAWVTDAQVQIQGGQYVCLLTLNANTGSTARTDTITISGTDIWGNTITATATLTQAGTSVTHAISVSWVSMLGYDGVLDYRGGTEQATISYTGTFTGNASVTTGSLPSGVSVSLADNFTLEATYTGGNIAQTKVIPITITRTGNDSVVYSAIINLTLQGGGVYPIWEDMMQHIVSDEDWEDYQLQEGGADFYSGRAFKYPDESDIQVNVSRVVAPYLTTYFMDVDFINDGVVLGSYTFVRDYSYDKSMDYTQNLWLNAPINGRVPAGVKLSVSLWGATGGGSMQVTDEGGSLVVNEAIAKGLNVGEWISGSTGKTYSFGSEKYEVVDVCRGALLKYVNAYGAIDYLLVEGVAKKTDKITRASYEKDAAAMSKDFESKDYQATMEATWKGTTGWLTDSQSLRMKHLVESVEVYMVDMSTGEEIPVTMRDSSLEYKTFDNNSRKMVNYSLSWTESQKKIRR